MQPNSIPRRVDVSAAQRDEQPPSSAQERLLQSRQRLANWLAEDGNASPHPGPGKPAALPRWLQGLRTNPIAAIVIDALAAQWSRHPLNTSLRLVSAAADRAIAPLVQKHPWAVLGGSAVIGALLVLSKPWRWLPKPAIAAGVAAQLTAQVISYLSALRPADAAVDDSPPNADAHHTTAQAKCAQCENMTR
jgi:hypothetical protein